LHTVPPSKPFKPYSISRAFVEHFGVLASLILCRLQDTSLCSPHVHRSALSRAIAVVSLNITLASGLEPKSLEALHKAVFEIYGGDAALKNDISQ
jgi:hypothetical protein